MSQKTFDEKIKSILSGTVPLIYQHELVEKFHQQELVLLDTRSSPEYNTSHINGARFIDYDNFTQEMVSDIDKDASVVVYCSVGYRSEKIGERLQKLGFTNVKNLYGGIFDWKNNGNDVVNNAGVTDSVHTYNKNWSQWLERGIKVYE